MGGLIHLSALPLTGCISLLVSAIFVVLAFASPYWASDDEKSIGLWRWGECSDGCWFVDRVDMDTPVWINVVRALIAIAIIFIGILLVSLPVYLYVSLGLYYRCAMIFSAISSALSAILVFVAVIVYGSRASILGWSLEWCFVITIIGGVFAVFGAIIFIVCIFTKKPDFKAHYEEKISRYLEPQPNVYMVQDNPSFYMS